jgi:hypothetical protein
LPGTTRGCVEIQDFVQHHRPSLERDEVRRNVILAPLDRLALDPPPNLRRWSRAASGACAAQSPGYPIVLGELTLAQCRALAEETRELDYPGVVGSRTDGALVCRAGHRARPERFYEDANSAFQAV